jgi:hypothetical protein
MNSYYYYERPQNNVLRGTDTLRSFHILRTSLGHAGDQLGRLRSQSQLGLSLSHVGWWGVLDLGSKHCLSNINVQKQVVPRPRKNMICAWNEHDANGKQVR